METYKKFKHRQAELENADQFMLQLCEIPHLKIRLDVLMVVNELPVQYQDLAPVCIQFVDDKILNCYTHSARVLTTFFSEPFTEDR